MWEKHLDRRCALPLEVEVLTSSDTKSVQRPRSKRATSGIADEDRGSDEATTPHMRQGSEAPRRSLALVLRAQKRGRLDSPHRHQELLRRHTREALQSRAVARQGSVRRARPAPVEPRVSLRFASRREEVRVRSVQFVKTGSSGTETRRGQRAPMGAKAQRR